MILHGLTLTPVSIHARIAELGAEVLPPAPVRPTREQCEAWLYGPDIWLPPEI